MDKRKLLIFLVIGLIIASFAYFNKSSSSVATAMVVKVIDGDTLELDDSSRVRLLGINTPERGFYYYQEAKDALKNLVENKEVKLEKDVSNNDKYGRLLRYIFIGDIFVNLEILKNGYANTYFIEPDVKYQKEFINAENQAEDNQLGLWEHSDYFSCIVIEEFHYVEKAKFSNDEYLALKNTCSYAISLSEWTVKDDGRHVYKFKNLMLQPNSVLTLNSGSGTDNSTHLFWNSKQPIWNNDGDTLYLRDSLGSLVLAYNVGR